MSHKREISSDADEALGEKMWRREKSEGGVRTGEKGLQEGQYSLRFVFHGFENLMRGLVDFESEDSGDVGVFWGRGKAFREDVREQMRKSRSEISAVDIGTGSMDCLWVIEILTSHAEQFD
jgi:hypothetical protein